MAKIDTLVKQHYESKQLEDSSLERLANMANTPAAPQHEAGRLPWLGRNAGTGAGIGLAIAATLIVTLLFTLPPDSELPGLQQRVAQEIALNHRKNLSVDYASGDLQILAAQMTKLDFELAPPQQFAARELVLIGARYCSIQGQIAAQLKYRSDKDGQLYTLYQTRMGSRLKPLQSGSLEHTDVAIELWKDNNLLMGLARDASAR